MLIYNKYFRIINDRRQKKRLNNQEQINKTRTHGYNEPVRKSQGGWGRCKVPEVLFVASKGKPNTG